MKKPQKTQRENPFKTEQQKSAGVDRTASRRRSIKKLQNIGQISLTDNVESDDKHQRLDVDALVIDPVNIDLQTSSGFVNVPQNKEALHPARFFKDLFLPKATEKGMSTQDVIDNLGISDEHFDDFLSEKVSVDRDFAKKLEQLTGMPYDFWLRTQNKFDDSNNEEPKKVEL